MDTHMLHVKSILEREYDIVLMRPDISDSVFIEEGIDLHYSGFIDFICKKKDYVSVIVCYYFPSDERMSLYDIIDYICLSDDYPHLNCRLYHNSSVDGETREYCTKTDEFIYYDFYYDGDEDSYEPHDSDYSSRDDDDDGYYDFCEGF